MLVAEPDRPQIKPHALPAEALQVPIMCNLGTKEGVSEPMGRFAGVWPANQLFFNMLRSQGGLVAVAIDPLTAHECGNQRYLAIPWLHECLAARLPEQTDEPLRPMPSDDVWLAMLTDTSAVAATEFAGDPTAAGWLPNAKIARLWGQYVRDTAVRDETPPQAPTNLRLADGVLRWEAVADLESGLTSFVIERNGEALAQVPEQPGNPYGRPLFQSLQYSDTPVQPLSQMEYDIRSAAAGQPSVWSVRAVNSVGLESEPVLLDESR
ncbi:MAG: hypothetical protein R3B90_23445 [Planctomycetaceae bacterium]